MCAVSKMNMIDEFKEKSHLLMALSDDNISRLLELFLIYNLYGEYGCRSMYVGAFVIFLKAMFWKNCVLFILYFLTLLHNWIPYVQMGFNKVLYINGGNFIKMLK